MDIIEIENILEAVSREQKEAGQRAMNAEYSKISYRLDEYFNKKWQNKKTKEDYINATKEKKRLALVKKFLKLGPVLSSKKGREFVKNTTGNEPEFRTRMSLSGENAFSQRFKNVVFTNSKMSDSKYMVPVGGGDLNSFDKNEFERLYKIWNKMIILHEYTHVFDYLKNYIETGKASLGIKGTYEMSDKVKDVEGSAMAGETDLVYRKDRREILQKRKTDKRSNLKFSHDKETEEYYKKLSNKEDPNRYRYRYIDALYLKGRYEHSKTLSPTLKSINVENVYKELVVKFNNAKKSFNNKIRQFNNDYKQKISLPNVRFGVLLHDKAKKPIYHEHDKIYIDVYAYKDVKEYWYYLFFEQLREILFEKYPELVKNDKRFKAYFEKYSESNFEHSETFENYERVLDGLKIKDIYESII